MFKKVDYLSLNDVVYEKIKEKIIDNILTPGERIDTEKLSGSLGVSKTPVTNALKLLSQNGYIIINPRSGTYVREFSYEEIEAIFDFRLVLEKLAVEKSIAAAKKSALQSFGKKLTQIGEKIKTETDKEELYLNKFFRIEIEIHEYIISLCPQIIGDQIQNLLDLTKCLRKQQLSRTLNKKGAEFFCIDEIDLHLKLVNAILNSNAPIACQCITTDITRTKNEILENYKQTTV